MTDTQYDRAPGDASALPDVEQGTSSGVLVYTIGLALAVILTAMSFWSPTHHCSGQAVSLSA
jgi:cytochrome o ubiquinol oxidase operon protein cyoD